MILFNMLLTLHQRIMKATFVHPEMLMQLVELLVFTVYYSQPEENIREATRVTVHEISIENQLLRATALRCSYCKLIVFLSKLLDD